MEYQDKTLTCRDCGAQFVFTAREQQFYADKGFTNAPVRCQNCRLKKKQAGGQGNAAGRAATASADRQLYTIRCKKCGKEGKMATEPRDPNDVLCSDCFYEEFKKEHAK